MIKHFPKNVNDKIIDIWSSKHWVSFQRQFLIMQAGNGETQILWFPSVTSDRLKNSKKLHESHYKSILHHSDTIYRGAVLCQGHIWLPGCELLEFS